MVFLAALQFLTSVPVKLKQVPGTKELGGAIALFPVIGLLIGLLLAGINWLLLYILPSGVVDIILVVILVALTGALHLDGFADTCDGMAGYRTVEERWQVMHDSRTGAFGVVGIVLVLLTKYVALSSVPSQYMTATLIFMPAVSRWAMVYAIFAFPYARPAGLGASYKEATRWPHFIIATIIVFALAGALFPLFSWGGLLVIPGTWIVVTLLSCYFKYKFRGNTGDTYGATNEISEVMALVFIVIICTTAPGLLE